MFAFDQFDGEIEARDAASASHAAPVDDIETRFDAERGKHLDESRPVIPVDCRPVPLEQARARQQEWPPGDPDQHGVLQRLASQQSERLGISKSRRVARRKHK